MSKMLQSVLRALGQDKCDANLLRWDLTAPQIAEAAEEFSALATSMYDKIAAAKSNPSWDSVCGAMADAETKFYVVDDILTYPQQISTEEAVRDAARDADKKLSDLFLDLTSRHDVYSAFKAYEDIGEPLEGERKRYFEHTMRGFKRKGLHLQKDEREKITALNKKMSALGIEFRKNLSEDKTTLLFTKDELAGMSDDFLSGLDKDESGDSPRYKVTLAYPHYYPVMKLCEVSETRRQLEFAYTSRCKDTNSKILEDLVTMRHELAQMLGYETHAAFVQEIRMAENPKRVMDFLTDLSDRLTPLQEKELDTLREVKREHENIPADDEVVINPWDISFYLEKVTKKYYNIDKQALKPYFPIEKVTKGLLEIYEELLGLTITETEDEGKWHEDAKFFTVNDAESGALVGHFYLDLHPREGKYTHAACWGLQPSVALKNGRLVPVASVLCNFTKPTQDKPALLLHSEVETYFHEFGHCMHQVCSLADMTLFAGTRVERDFVELPSQILENWVWERDALLRMSGHYETNEPIPDELIEKLIASRHANSGILTKRQILYATFDQTIHTRSEADTAQVFGDLCTTICKYPSTKGTNFAASFGHMAGGYDAQYYGYLWSEVFAMDVFANKFKGRIFDSAVGLEYRKKILAPGGTRDANDMLVDFLGRKPRLDAFLESRGLDPTNDSK